MPGGRSELSKSEKFALIQELRSKGDSLLTVESLCATAGVSPSGYYNWAASEDKRREREAKDRKDFARVLKAYEHRGYAKGARGIYMTLLHSDRDAPMNLKKIRRLMKKYGLSCPFRQENPYRKMMRALQTNRRVKNLVNRDFTTKGRRKVLLTDITYMKWNGEHVYLSTLLDACTRQILGWQLSRSLEVDFVLDTLKQALERHPEIRNPETLIHSDQGSHYTSIAFRDLLKDEGLTQSMSRRGNCWDNAPQESFFGHMKDEFNLQDCTTWDDAYNRVKDWIDYYNSERYQWGLEMLSPDEYDTYLQTHENPLAGAKGQSKDTNKR